MSVSTFYITAGRSGVAAKRRHPIGWPISVVSLARPSASGAASQTASGTPGSVLINFRSGRRSSSSTGNGGPALAGTYHAHHQQRGPAKGPTYGPHTGLGAVNPGGDRR